jgi:hypothetical protein
MRPLNRVKLTSTRCRRHRLTKAPPSRSAPPLRFSNRGVPSRSFSPPRGKSLGRRRRPRRERHLESRPSASSRFNRSAKPGRTRGEHGHDAITKWGHVNVKITDRFQKRRKARSLLLGLRRAAAAGLSSWHQSFRRVNEICPGGRQDVMCAE